MYRTRPQSHQVQPPFTTTIELPDINCHWCTAQLRLPQVYRPTVAAVRKRANVELPDIGVPPDLGVLLLRRWLLENCGLALLSHLPAKHVVDLTLQNLPRLDCLRSSPRGL